MTFGRISSICRTRYGLHAATSSGIGLRLPGGRCLRTLQMKTSSRLEFDGGENLREQLAGLSDERPPLFVLVRAGRLADAHEIRVRVRRRQARDCSPSRRAGSAGTPRRRRRSPASDVSLAAGSSNNARLAPPTTSPAGTSSSGEAALLSDCVDGTCTASRGGCGAGFESARGDIGSSRSTACNRDGRFRGAAGLADAPARQSAVAGGSGRDRRGVASLPVARGAGAPAFAPSSASASSTLIESSTSSVSPSSRRCSR